MFTQHVYKSKCSPERSMVYKYEHDYTVWCINKIIVKIVAHCINKVIVKVVYYDKLFKLYERILCL